MTLGRSRRLHATVLDVAASRPNIDVRRRDAAGPNEAPPPPPPTKMPPLRRRSARRDRIESITDVLDADVLDADAGVDADGDLSSCKEPVPESGLARAVASNGSGRSDASIAFRYRHRRNSFTKIANSVTKITKAKPRERTRHKHQRTSRVRCSATDESHLSRFDS